MSKRKPSPSTPTPTLPPGPQRHAIGIGEVSVLAVKSFNGNQHTKKKWWEFKYKNRHGVVYTERVYR